MRVHFLHIKERFRSAFRKNRQPPEKYTSIQLFADLSQFAMQRRKSLLPITKALRNHDITYWWGYPSKLTITKDDHTSVINNLDEGLALLRTGDILPDKSSEGPTSSSKLKTQDTWQVVSHKKKTNSATAEHLNFQLYPNLQDSYGTMELSVLDFPPS